MKAKYFNPTLVFISLFIVVVFSACSSSYDEILEPTPEVQLVEQVNGRLINVLTGEGIPNYEVRLVWKSLFDGGITDIAKTDQDGKFYFYEGGEIEIRNYSLEYQLGVWVDNEFRSLFYAFGTRTKFNPDAPQELTIGMYPRTSFNVQVTNVNPINEDDLIKVFFRNIRSAPWLDQESGYSVEFKGLNVNELIQDDTAIENELFIRYEVIKNGQSETFERTVACTPGGLTEINIEY